MAAMTDDQSIPVLGDAAQRAQCNQGTITSHERKVLRTDISQECLRYKERDGIYRVIATVEATLYCHLDVFIGVDGYVIAILVLIPDPQWVVARVRRSTAEPHFALNPIHELCVSNVLGHDYDKHIRDVADLHLQRRYRHLPQGGCRISTELHYVARRCPVSRNVVLVHCADMRHHTTTSTGIFRQSVKMLYLRVKRRALVP